jgi:maltose O-acetyltransferase
MDRSEREKMLADEPYLASDPELVRMRERARDLCGRFNTTAATERGLRTTLLRELFGRAGDGVWIEPPFYCDYGCYVFLGDGAYMNFGCVILDCNEVHVGSAVKFGPNVQVYAGYHPVDPAHRRTGLEMARPIRIGDNAWIGGGAIICPGVEIGADTTIGAGSVVTKSIPPRVVAAGNPCRVIRRLD